jgi:hypothetical protein
MGVRQVVPHDSRIRRGLVIHPEPWDGRIAGADQWLRCGCSINITRRLYASALSRPTWLRAGEDPRPL